MMSLKEMQESLTAAMKTNERLKKLRKCPRPPLVITAENIPDFTIPPSYLQLCSQTTLQNHFARNPPSDNDEFFKRISMANIFPNNFSRSILDILKKPKSTKQPYDGHDIENGRSENEDCTSNDDGIRSWSSVLQKPSHDNSMPEVSRRMTVLQKPSHDNSMPEVSRRMTVLGKPQSDGYHVPKFTSPSNSNLNEDCFITPSLEDGPYMPSWYPMQGTRGNVQMSEILKMGMGQLGIEKQIGVPQRMDDTNQDGVNHEEVPSIANTYAMCLTDKSSSAVHRAGSVDSNMPNRYSEGRNFYKQRQSLSKINSKE